MTTVVAVNNNKGEVPPNLALVRKFHSNWTEVRKNIDERQTQLKQYVSAGGQTTTAIFLKAFALRQGPNVQNYSQTGEFFLFAGGDEKEGSLKLECRGPAREKIAELLELLPEQPTTWNVQVFSTHHIACPMDVLDKIPHGSIVRLTDVTARCYVVTSDTNAPRWNFNVEAKIVQPLPSLSMMTLYPAIKEVGSSYMIPILDDYDESIPFSKRYDRSNTYIMSVRSSDTELELLERIDRESGETSLLQKNMDERSAFEMESIGGKPRVARAELNFLSIQWPKSADPSHAEKIMVSATLWAEKLCGFGISDIDTWVAVAKMIFINLDFKLIGYPDHKGTTCNFGGVEMDPDIQFALQLMPLGIIPDLEGCYRRCGIMVDADHVETLQQEGQQGAAGAAFTGDVRRWREDTPDVVPMTGPSASASLSRAIIAHARQYPGEIEFCVLIPMNWNKQVKNCLAKLSSEEKNTLVMALVTDHDAEDPALGLGESAQTLLNLRHNHASKFVAFAFVKNAIPTELREENNSKMRKFIGAGSGHFVLCAAPAPPPAIEEARVEEVSESESLSGKKRSADGIKKKKKTRVGKKARLEQAEP